VFTPGAAGPEAGPPGAADDDRRARDTLKVFGEQERSQRMVGGFALLLTGAGSVGAGLLADLEYDESYGQPLWIGGAALGASGLLSLFKAGPIEDLATQSAGLSAPLLKDEWAKRASTAATSRQISGWVGIGLGVIAGGAGAAVASGVGDLQESEKESWSVALIAIGGALLGGGVGSLLVESQAEVGYRAAYGTLKPSSISLRLAPSSGGGLGGLQGRF